MKTFILWLTLYGFYCLGVGAQWLANNGYGDFSQIIGLCTGSATVICTLLIRATQKD